MPIGMAKYLRETGTMSGRCTHALPGVWDGTSVLVPLWSVDNNNEFEPLTS